MVNASHTHQLALIRSAVDPLGELQTLLPEVLRRFEGRSQTAKSFEKQGNGFSDLLVRIEFNAVLLVIDKPHGQPHPEFSARRHAQRSTPHAFTDHMQLGF